MHKAGAISAILGALNHCDHLLDHLEQRRSTRSAAPYENNAISSDRDIMSPQQTLAADSKLPALLKRNNLPPGTKSESAAAAIAMPLLFALVFAFMFALIWIIPRCASVGGATMSTAENQKKKRLQSLDELVKPQMFKDWFVKEAKSHPGGILTPHAICVICLEVIDDEAPVRGLNCLHVFHQNCLDDWFSRFNEFCPLCHQPILPSKASKHKSKKGLLGRVHVGSRRHSSQQEDAGESASARSGHLDEAVDQERGDGPETGGQRGENMV